MKTEQSDRDKCLSGYKYRQKMTLREYREWEKTAPEHRAELRVDVVYVQFGEIEK